MKKDELISNVFLLLDRNIGFLNYLYVEELKVLIDADIGGHLTKYVKVIYILLKNLDGVNKQDIKEIFKLTKEFDGICSNLLREAETLFD